MTVMCVCNVHITYYVPTRECICVLHKRASSYNIIIRNVTIYYMKFTGLDIAYYLKVARTFYKCIIIIIQ